MQRQESRLVMCGYAINAFHDDERMRRKREGISDEQSWHQHCEQARIQFPLGRLSERCGKPAVILTLHREGDLLPYCASCFSYDAAVNDGGFIFIRLPSFSSEDLRSCSVPRLGGEKGDMTICLWPTLRDLRVQGGGIPLWDQQAYLSFRKPLA